jgi:hypothetical protein
LVAVAVAVLIWVVAVVLAVLPTEHSRLSADSIQLLLVVEEMEQAQREMETLSITSLVLTQQMVATH